MAVAATAATEAVAGLTVTASTATAATEAAAAVLAHMPYTGAQPGSSGPDSVVPPPAAPGAAPATMMRWTLDARILRAAMVLQLVEESDNFSLVS